MATSTKVKFPPGIIIPVQRETAVLRVNPSLPTDPSLRAIGNEVAGSMRFAMTAVAADPSAAARDEFGTQFATFLRTRPKAMREHAKSRAAAVLSSPEVIRRGSFGRYANLSAADYAQFGLEGIGGRVGRLAIDPKATRLAFERLRQALVKVPADADGGGIHADAATLNYTKLRLFVKRVRCIEETDEIGSDEILMSSVNSDPFGNSWIGHTWEVHSDMDEGDLVEYPGIGHKVTGWNLVTNQGWPCVYGTLLCLAEEDDGGFGAFLKELWQQVKSKVEELGLALLAGVAAGAATANVLVGIAVAVVVAIIDFLVGLLTENEDEIAKPAALTLTLAAATKSYYDWAKLTATDGLTGVLNYHFDDGHYRVLFGYKVFTS